MGNFFSVKKNGKEQRTEQKKERKKLHIASTIGKVNGPSAQ